MDLIDEPRVTGRVDISASFGGAGARRGTRMTFHPGARTAWHSHPAGQTLLVVAGEGLLQRESGRIEPMRAGDVVWVEPDQRHWFGAGPDAPITLIALVHAAAIAETIWVERASERVDRAA